MMYEDLPIWVFELVAAVDKYEDEHAQLDAFCFGNSYEHVPKEVKTVARILKRSRESGNLTP